VGYVVGGLFSESFGAIIGFKYTGVYPFNPRIVLDNFPGTDRNDTTVVPVTDNGKPNENVSSAEEEDGITVEEKSIF